MHNLIQTLTDIWLTSEEAQVYLSVLRFWISTPTQIARNSWLKRTSVNNYIVTLLSKWVLQRSVEWKRMKYIAESPEKVLKNLDRKRQNFVEKLPVFNNLFLNASQKANVRYFEGKNGITEIYREISLWFLPIVSFYSIERYLDYYGDMKVMDEFVKNIVSNENTIKDLIEDTPVGRKVIKTRESKSKTWKLLPPEFELWIDLLIQGEKVAMISYTTEMGIIIENKDISDFHRNTFQHFWNLLD